MAAFPLVPAVRRRVARMRARQRRLALCTIATEDFLPWCLVLFDALARQHPAARRILLFVGRPGETRLPRIPGVDVMPVTALLDGPLEAQLRARYTNAELCFALKPRLLRAALDAGAERAIYLDSDIDVRSPLEAALVALEDASVALTPHLDTPIAMDGRLPSELTILRAGIHNAGFVAVAEGEETRRFLDWWDARVMRWGYVRPEAGMHGDQKWLDLAGSYFPGVAKLRDPGSNVGSWNLTSRSLTRHGDEYRVNGLPLAFYHFSGFDPDRPQLLSRYQNRYAEHPVVAELGRDFAARLVAARPRAAALAWDGEPPPPLPQAAATVATGPLPNEAYRAAIAASNDQGVLAAGEDAWMRVTVRNDSPHAWPVGRSAQGQGGIALSWHIRRRSGEMLSWDNRRYFLPHDLAPGETLALDVAMRVPLQGGGYWVDFDLLHEGTCWFNEHGSPLATFELWVDAFPA